jgi:hypothetical protein
MSKADQHNDILQLQKKELTKMTDEPTIAPSYQPDELRDATDEYLRIARRISGEGEVMEIDDELSIEQMVQLRSFLMSTRTAVDMVSGALARNWNEHFPDEQLPDEFGHWYVGHTKKKSIVDGEMFLAWLASLDAEQLGKVFNPNRLAEVVKVSGLTPAERDTHLSEEYSQTAGISIKYYKRQGA